MELNPRALAGVERLLRKAELRRVAAHPIEGGGRFVDAGIDARGGLLAGLDLARICLAGLGKVGLVAGEVDGHPCPTVQVATDHPLAACLASQYAGWALSEGKFFAMGSGPFRAAKGSEKVFEEYGLAESAAAVVGVLEGRKPPTPGVVATIARECRVAPSAVTLVGAPTASAAGSVQVVARSAETAMHKLHALGFDLRRVVSAFGSAPLPPIARDDLAAIGRTNDAILYGARVVLQVTGDDASLDAIGPQVPSSASKDHGEPFAAIFERAGRDFYAIDPLLFSPAVVAFENVETGRSRSHGRVEPALLARSFYG